MLRAFRYVPGAAIFLAGVAAGALALPRRGQVGMNPEALDELKKSIADLDIRLNNKEAADQARFAQVETRLDEHTARLADVPSTSQIVAAMEQLLSKTMASLDERLTTQANSIDVLKTTVSQTDNLLERVLESLDSLHSYAGDADLADDPVLSRPAV
jgi:chromosome segregation ATPase